jgi:hypothetical protein
MLQIVHLQDCQVSYEWTGGTLRCSEVIESMLEFRGNGSLCLFFNHFESLLKFPRSLYHVDKKDLLYFLTHLFYTCFKLLILSIALISSRSVVKQIDRQRTLPFSRLVNEVYLTTSNIKIGLVYT